jgi:hypothetical protein
MALIGYPSPARFGAAVLAVLALAATTRAEDAAGKRAAADGVEFAGHRAIYDLRLAGTKGNRALSSVRGRIVYDFSGNACEGYALQFRQVTELDTGEGKSTVSDLRSTTWEDGAAQTFRFNSQNYMSDELKDDVDGIAERQGDEVAVKLRKPQPRALTLGPVAFPTDHMRRIIAAAHAGTSLVELPVYDGSDKGEKVYQSLTVIGHRIAPDERKPTDAAARIEALAGMARWPVTISYFDTAGKDGGEQMPAYAITFELYDNGISRALLLDYGDFSVAGEMTSLELKPAKPCK